MKKKYIELICICYILYLIYCLIILSRYLCENWNRAITCNFHFPFDLPFSVQTGQDCNWDGEEGGRGGRASTESWILFPNWPPWCNFSEVLCAAKKLNCTQDECNLAPKNSPLCAKTLHYLWMQKWFTRLWSHSHCFSSLFFKIVKKKSWHKQRQWSEFLESGKIVTGEGCL